MKKGAATAADRWWLSRGMVVNIYEVEVAMVLYIGGVGVLGRWCGLIWNPTDSWGSMRTLGAATHTHKHTVREREILGVGSESGEIFAQEQQAALLAQLATPFSK